MEAAVAIIAAVLVGLFAVTVIGKAVARKKGKGKCGCDANCASCPYRCGEKPKDEDKEKR